MKEAGIDKGYEFYQIITDFDDPVQIFREAYQNSTDEKASQVFCRVHIEKRLGTEDLYIDIWDNGIGLSKNNVDYFFGLAKSTKINSDKTPTPGKLGYKGHGTKIFFNAETIEIYSKTSKDEWGVKLENPLIQIRDNGHFRYSDFLPKTKMTISLPNDWKSGFFVRIKNPNYFKTQHTRYMLNHMYLRDYSKWFTVFGSLRPLFDNKIKDIYLYLQGLNIKYFQDKYNDVKLYDPKPEFETVQKDVYEKIKLGHYFPKERYTENQMESYAKKIASNRPYYDFYSREIVKQRIACENNIAFDFILYAEGYETKRRYDILLSRSGKSTVISNLVHTDAVRYGIWACKGGVPIEKVDDWIIGGRGVGTYTYMHGFIDCDYFDLTANRGSIRNTNLETLEIIKKKLNEILSDKKTANLLKEREEVEEMEKTLRSIEEDYIELKKRFKEAQTTRTIKFPNGVEISEPQKTKSGYSESETLILLLYIIDNYPDLFKFKLLDYNTTKGIDFVIDHAGNPKYIELKGTMQKKVNHSFRKIYKFICYDINIKANEMVTDVEELITMLKINKNDKFESFHKKYKNKPFKSYMLVPNSPVIESMEIIVLKEILKDVLGAKIM